MMVDGLLVEMLEQPGEIGEKIFMLVAATVVGPFAIAVTA